MDHTFNLPSGAKVVTTVKENKDCIVTSELIISPEGVKGTRYCKVSCHSGKSYSWTCDSKKQCEGKCIGGKPSGKCV